jgi:hypothetical protein
MTSAAYMTALATSEEKREHCDKYVVKGAATCEHRLPVT